MPAETIRLLLTSKEKLYALFDEINESVFGKTLNPQLHQDIQKNVLDYISDTADQIDTIVEDMEKGVYNCDNDEDSD